MPYLKDRKNALGFAFSGLLQAMKQEPHMKIHLWSAVTVCVAGWFFDIGNSQWILICGCITLVMITEIINTAIEKICDLVSNEIRPEIKYIKDISAAAVLLACIFALVTGLIIFVPHIKSFL